MHKTMKAILFKNNVKVYVNRDSYKLLLKTMFATGKVWEKWYLSSIPIGKGFQSLLNSKKSLNKTLK